MLKVNHVIKGQFYKGITGNDHGFHGHFSIIPLLNSMLNNGIHKMAMLYPNPCYNKVCYKRTAL